MTRRPPEPPSPAPTSTGTAAVWSAADGCPAEAHPKIAALHRYWQDIHPPGRLPGRQHLDPADIPGLLSGIWMLDVFRDPLRFRYRLAGTQVVAAMRHEVTGRWVHEVFGNWSTPHSPRPRYEAVVERAIPSWRKGPPFNADLTRCPMLENILLPLATDGRTVDILLALTVYYWADG